MSDEKIKWIVDQSGDFAVREVNVLLVDGTSLAIHPKAFRMQMSLVTNTRQANAVGLFNYFRDPGKVGYKLSNDIAFRLTVGCDKIESKSIGEDPVHIVSNTLKKLKRQGDETITRRIVRPTKEMKET